MTMTDPIADLLTRIRNGCMAGKRHISVPHSKIKAGILEVLLQEGFIRGYRVEEATPPSAGRQLHIDLKYHNNKPSIASMRRISRPSLRIYRGKDELSEFALDPWSVTVVSTPNGVMSYRQAQRENVGGEILFVIS